VLPATVSTSCLGSQYLCNSTNTVMYELCYRYGQYLIPRISIPL
jgi:hypothetical protein